MGGRRRFRRYSSHASPPGFFPASGYLLIGYSKISETRRYRRKKRGDAREKTREPEEEGKRTREVEKEGVERERKRERERAGGRVVADRTRERVGVNYHYPPKTRLSFCSPRISFCFFPRYPTPPTPPSESFDSSARLCHPLTLSSSISSSTPFYSSSSSSTFSSSSCSYHRPPKIRVRYYLSPDRFRSTTPANVLYHPALLSSLLTSPMPRHGRPTITGPRTI